VIWFIYYHNFYYHNFPQVSVGRPESGFIDCTPEEATMMSAASLRLAALIICASSVISADAKTWQQVAPHGLDQTIYQPTCWLGDCTCDCLSDRSCLPFCVR
jgi:hypothetical protein